METKTHRPFAWEKGRRKAGATDRTLQLKQVAEGGGMGGVEEDPVAEQAADAKPEGDAEEGGGDKEGSRMGKKPTKTMMRIRNIVSSTSLRTSVTRRVVLKVTTTCPIGADHLKMEEKRVSVGVELETPSK